MATRDAQVSCRRHTQLAISLVLGTAVCCAYAQTQAPQMREINVGMGLPKPPYIMESGTAGLDYDIAKQALAAGGYRMVGQMLPQTRALAMVRSGQLDGMLSVSEGIGGPGYFSDTYVVYRNVATTLSHRNIKLSEIEDLMHYSVAAFQTASMVLGDRFAQVATSHSDYREVPSQATQNKLLFLGRVDVVVGDQLIFQYFSTQLGKQINTSQPVTFHRLFPESHRKILFRDMRARDAFNAGLKKIHADGTYDAIVSRYLDKLTP